MMAAGRLTPHLGCRLPWSRTNDAVDALAGGYVEGKAVLEVT